MAEEEECCPCEPPKRKAKMRTAAGAIGVVAPMLVMVATKPDALSPAMKVGLVSIAGVTLVLDSAEWRRHRLRQAKRKGTKSGSVGRRKRVGISLPV
jgi:hypothetical protein